VNQSLRYSVIVPTYNSRDTIQPCLKALSEYGQNQNGGRSEIIVVDAGSLDQTPSLVKELSCNVIQSKHLLNPGQARNLGAQNARGDILVFVDSDVVIHPDSIPRFREHFEGDAKTAITGVYSKPTRDESFASAFQTLLLRNRFMKLKSIVKTPTSAIFAIRKEDFYKVGGFDERLRTYEDFDLGRRLDKVGIHFQVDARIEGHHLKKFSLKTLLQDYWVKAKNMMTYRLGDADRRSTLVSNSEVGLPSIFFWSGIISLPIALGLLLAATGAVSVYWVTAAWVVYLAIAFPFLLYLGRERGVWFAARGSATLFLCQLTTSLAMVYATVQYVVRRMLGSSSASKSKLQKIMKLPRFLNIGRRMVYKQGLPIQLVFFVTSRCNLHCEHCFYLPNLNKPKNELSLDEIEKISRSLSDLLWLALTGGEPLLRKDLDQVVELFYKNNRVRKFTITTNGILKDQSIELLEKILRKIPKAQLMVYFSLDGLPDTHDKIRRVPNGFQRTVATLDAAKELKKSYPNLFISTITTCTAHNQWEMAPLANKILDEIKPDNMVVNLVRGEVEDPSLKNLDIKNYQAFIQIQQEAIRSGRLGYFKFLGRQFLLAKEARQKEIVTDVFLNQHYVTPCYAGHLSAVLYEHGDVAPCEILNTSYGNIRDHDLDFGKLWKRLEVRAHAKNIIEKKCFCTYECALTTNILFNPKHALKSMQTKSSYT